MSCCACSFSLRERKVLGLADQPTLSLSSPISLSQTNFFKEAQLIKNLHNPVHNFLWFFFQIIILLKFLRSTLGSIVIRTSHYSRPVIGVKPRYSSLVYDYYYFPLKEKQIDFFFVIETNGSSLNHYVIRN
jgi:hypothetical protein